MTLSYNWLLEYLPVNTGIQKEWIEPEKLSRILTALGLEVENMQPFEEVPGGLAGLVVGEVLTCEKHQDADKLSICWVATGSGEPLQIVCGANNVAKGQKVIVAPAGATIYPRGKEPMEMKKAKIRGVESNGMIVAEDEIGLGTNHDGIMVLSADAVPGSPASEYFNLYTDVVYEIGLTPNRMDAMSHLGVAKDVCAWISHHYNRQVAVKSPLKRANAKQGEGQPASVSVEIRNTQACQRYCGVVISSITVGESPEWLKKKLLSIGQRPINNVVDITNFILHETGQPLHAFDLDKVEGKKIIVENLPADTRFTTLDGKERSLSAEDLMICDGSHTPLCIGGVFGGLHSGVTTETKHIFLESAWFNPQTIRKTSFRHGLRTDAATRFEKGVDIDQTLQVLQRGATLIAETAGGQLLELPIDNYPVPLERKQIQLRYHYLKKLSGKNFHPDSVRQILQALGFEVVKEGIDDIWLLAPWNKPDVSLPADVVEEIMRIDGYDQIDIPEVIQLSPSAYLLEGSENAREQTAQYLAGLGFSEILTNSITQSRYYSTEELDHTVGMLNSLTAELDVMRPSMLESILECVAFNANRRNNDLKLFEFGKTYYMAAEGRYDEADKLALVATGQLTPLNWRIRQQPADIYYLKGIVERLLEKAGILEGQFVPWASSHVAGFQVCRGREVLGFGGQVSKQRLQDFGIKQPVWFAELDWNKWLALGFLSQKMVKELPRFPATTRDIAMVLPKLVPYAEVHRVVASQKINILRRIDVFDVFESEKIGVDKKSLAVSLVFMDDAKTLTDDEVDKAMGKITKMLEKELAAEIRRG